MSGQSRRQFLGVGATAVTAAALAAFVQRVGCAEGELCRRRLPGQALGLSALGEATQQMQQRFDRWLRSAALSREPAVRNLLYNFKDPNAERGVWIYPMLTGKAMLWLLRRGRIDEARRMAATLIRWQQRNRQDALALSYGAFPSEVRLDGKRWSAGERYYAGDNLVIVDALLALHRRTGERRWLDRATETGTWLVQVMCRGQQRELWVEDHGAPMHFVTARGDFSNAIHGGVTMLWLSALHRLGQATDEPAYCRQADRAFEFLRKGQHVDGAYYHHYDPGYPAEPYSPGRWRPYATGQLISDDVLRSALGACRLGDHDAARKLLRWLRVEQGGIPAYLDLETGRSGFAEGQPVYFDVTSTALHRSLCQWLAERPGAEQDVAFLSRTQHESGTWYWGLRRDDLEPIEPQLSPMPGLWATDDLSQPVT